MVGKIDPRKYLQIIIKASENSFYMKKFLNFSIFFLPWLKKILPTVMVA